MKWWWSQSLFLSSPYKCVLQRECTEDLLWWRRQPKSLSSSYWEARSIHEHILNSCCRNQPSERNQEMPWAQRSTSIIPFIYFFYLLSLTFLILFLPFVPPSASHMPLPLPFLPTVLSPFLLFVTGLIHLSSFYSSQFFSLGKRMTACCACNPGFLEKNKLILQPVANSLKSILTTWSPSHGFLCLFHFVFGKISL